MGPEAPEQLEKTEAPKAEEPSTLQKIKQWIVNLYDDVSFLEEDDPNKAMSKILKESELLKSKFDSLDPKKDKQKIDDILTLINWDTKFWAKYINNLTRYFNNAFLNTNKDTSIEDVKKFGENINKIRDIIEPKSTEKPTEDDWGVKWEEEKIENISDLNSRLWEIMSEAKKDNLVARAEKLLKAWFNVMWSQPKPLQTLEQYINETYINTKVGAPISEVEKFENNINKIRELIEAEEKKEEESKTQEKSK